MNDTPVPRGRGRPKGTSGPAYKQKKKRISLKEIARDQALSKARDKLPLKWKGNALALLQIVYCDTSLDIRTRIDAAKVAIGYEVARPEVKQTAPDVVPLHERLKEYAREKAITSSDGKVVDMRGK